MSEDKAYHDCGYCDEPVDVTEANGNPGKVAAILLAHLKLTCPGGVAAVDAARLVEAAASTELAGATPSETEGVELTDFYAHWDLVSMGGVILHTHHERMCHPPCCIHSPSGHHMRTWEQAWSQQLRAVFRRCPHGYFHPDPDDLSARTGAILHTCDGCCLGSRDETTRRKM